jgi:uncharacterized protein DUF6644
MTLLEVCEWLETTALAVAIQESLYGFAIAVAVHILGVAASVGMLLWVDLRLLGVALMQRPLNEVYRSLAPWFAAGFGITLLSGAALFTAFATAAYGNPFFRIKLLLLLLAGVNALVFHRFAAASPKTPDDAAAPPTAARLAGLFSLAIWAGVIVMGRMMSYTMFSPG